MEVFNDCYLFGFVEEFPTEATKKDIWKARLPLSFLSIDNKLTTIEMVLSNEALRTEFLKQKPYNVLWVHGSLQFHDGEKVPYLFVKEFSMVGLSKSMRSAILRLMGHTGSLVFLQGVMEDDENLFVPRIGQKKNVTDGDRFRVTGPTFRGQLMSDLSLRKEANRYGGDE